MSLTAWRLTDPAGIATYCTLIPHEGCCELRLEQTDRLVHIERQPNVVAALRRADALWIECQLDGWTEWTDEC